MIFSRRLALHRFVRTHPPSRQVSPASRELVSAYEGVLPASLTELWRRKGLGFYGDRQIALIDPRPWQGVLDRWVISPPDDVRRVPVALMPFGVLLYYRKLTATDEDVVYVDPVSKKTGSLAWNLDDSFNNFLCEQDWLEAILPPAMERSAREQCGALAPGEVYDIDQMLFSMQMLRIAKVDALAMHRRLRDALYPPKPKADEPNTVGEALPVEYRPIFSDIAAGRGLSGLYLSSYVDWHRLLALQPDGRYLLLLWRIHHKTFERFEIRDYSGAYELSRDSHGDETVALDMTWRKGSPSDDAHDQRLVAMDSGGMTFLLRAVELERMATAIIGRDLLGRSDNYFRRVTLDDAFSEEPDEGRVAPPLPDLPHALRVLVAVGPLRTTITHVADPYVDHEDQGEGTVMCTLDLGEKDGLRMNMPLYSPRDTGRGLRGWVWGMAPHACSAGIKYRRGEDGAIANGPVVGDVLTTRALDR